MKCVIKKSILLENLVNTSKAISSKNLIPILTGIKFDLDERGLTLTGSDTDLSISTFIPVENHTKQNITVFSTGSCVLNAKYVTEFDNENAGVGHFLEKYLQNKNHMI